jgi:hypothetical protein
MENCSGPVRLTMTTMFVDTFGCSYWCTYAMRSLVVSSPIWKERVRATLKPGSAVAIRETER